MTYIFIASIKICTTLRLKSTQLTTSQMNQTLVSLIVNLIIQQKKLICQLSQLLITSHSRKTYQSYRFVIMGPNQSQLLRSLKRNHKKRKKMKANKYQKRKKQRGIQRKKVNKSLLKRKNLGIVEPMSRNNLRLRSHHKVIPRKLIDLANINLIRRIRSISMAPKSLRKCLMSIMGTRVTLHR